MCKDYECHECVIVNRGSDVMPGETIIYECGNILADSLFLQQSGDVAIVEVELYGKVQDTGYMPIHIRNRRSYNFSIFEGFLWS